MKTVNAIIKPHAILALGTALTIGLCLVFVAASAGAAGSAGGAPDLTLIWSVIGLSCLALAIAGYGRSSSVRRFERRIDQAVGAIAALEKDAFDQEIECAEDDQFQPIMRALAELRRKLRQTSAAGAAADQLNRALVHLQVAVMVTDRDDRIVFLNDSLNDLLGREDSRICRDLCGRDVDSVVGSNLTEICSSVQHTDSLPDRNPMSNQMELVTGENRFLLNVSCIRDAADQFCGKVFVWTERTHDQHFEQQVSAIVHAATLGDLSQRIDAPPHAGFKQSLAEGINRLMEICEAVVNDTLRVFGALAGGRLDETIDADYEGSFDQLKADANSTVARLREVVVNIQQSSESVSTAFREINEGNLNLSQRTEQQAASLEETSCSMEQMTATVQKNAENAQRANDQAIKAREQAQNGGRVVGQAVTAMTEINDASEKIAAIIGVIDEIAFQTNLLALNASVEAARAGEQGRGFAVVAGEVRNLAGRSAEAAKEIKVLIQDSVAKVENGSALVDESGRTLNAIVAGVQEVTDIVAEISAASLEQASGIAEVNSTITQMDDMTQQNAALVEEVSAASESAGEQARNLSTLISFFATDELDCTPLCAAPVSSAPSHPALEQRWQPTQLPATAAVVARQAANSDIAGDWEEF